MNEIYNKLIELSNLFTIMEDYCKYHSSDELSETILPLIYNIDQKIDEIFIIADKQS